MATIGDNTTVFTTIDATTYKQSGSTIANLLLAQTSGTTLTAAYLAPTASVTVAGINAHKLLGIGDITGTTAYGMGAPTKPTTGIMASFGRTAIASATLTDTGLDVRYINKLVNTGANTGQAAYLKAKNYSGGTVGGDLLGLFIEVVNDGTVSGTTIGLKIGSDGSTLATDILLHNGATIANTDANTLTITEATVAIAGAATVSGALSVTGALTLGTNGVGGSAVSLVVKDGANPGASTSLVYADFTKIAGITAGTAEASKALVVDANKDITGLRYVTSGAVGTPGGFKLSDGANPEAKATIQTDTQTADITVRIPDPGNMTDAFVALSSAALTAAEVDVLDAVTPGTAAASKAVVLDAQSKIDVLDITTPKFNGTAVTATAAQLNSLAGAQGGLASILSAGLGGSDSITKSQTGSHTLIAAHATKDRACIVVVYVDETFADGDTSQTTIQCGEADTLDKAFATTLLTGATAGTVFVKNFTNTATKAIVATSVAAAGTGTGGATITVLAIPTT